jgi:hypothetical protein
MEFESPARPLHTAADVGTGGLVVFSIEDYLATHESAFKADQNAAAVSKNPPSKKIKMANIANSLNPNNAAYNAASNASRSGATPVPVAIGAKSSKYTVLLNEKYQAYGIERPEFVFEGDTVRGWCVRTCFRGQNFGPLGPFSSKQQGKEALSKKVLQVLLAMEKEGRFEKGTKEQKEVKVQEKADKKAKEAGPNWVGLLLGMYCTYLLLLTSHSYLKTPLTSISEFQRACSSPQALYTDYSLGTRFSCLVTIEGLTSHPQPFGSTTALFSSKKAARQHAASCVVDYYKAQGLWPENVAAAGGIKKKKVVQAPPAPKARKSSDSASADNTPVSPGGMSYPQQAAQLSTALGLGTPEWRFHPEDPAAPGFLNASCFFKSGGQHEGPIGEVRNIFGKKRAKEECARLTVEYLQGVKEQRMEYGARMLASVQGGEAAGSAAVKEGVEGIEAGEKKVEGKTKGELDVETDSDVEFEGKTKGELDMETDSDVEFEEKTNDELDVEADSDVEFEGEMKGELDVEADSDVEFEDAMEEF